MTSKGVSRFILAVLCGALIGVIGVLVFENPQDVSEVDIEDITGTPLERAYAIADFVTQSSDGLVSVSYADTPLHRTNMGQAHYGVHYNMFVTKRADLLTLQDQEQIQKYVGLLFKLTTEHIMVDERQVLYMSVQRFDADVWFGGGHESGNVRIYIAPKSQLLSYAGNEDVTLLDWLNVATGYPEAITPE